MTSDDCDEERDEDMGGRLADADLSAVRLPTGDADHEKAQSGDGPSALRNCRGELTWIF